jgi:hypothetical protein
MGWTYPVGMSAVRSTLNARGAFVDRLSTSGGQRGPRTFPTVLLRVLRFGDVRSGPRDAHAATWFYLNAVPVEEAEVAQQLLLGGLLDQAAEWVADISGRGNAWTSSEHQWRATMSSGVSSVAES